MWRERNTLIHGNDEETSKLEIAKTDALVQLIYDDLLPNIHPAHKWLFVRRIDDKLQEGYPSKVAWIDSVRRLYPAKCKHYRSIVGKTCFRREDLEYNKAARLGATDI